MSCARKTSSVPLDRWSAAAFVPVANICSQGRNSNVYSYELFFCIDMREKIECVVSYVSLSSSQFGICSSFRQSLLRIQTSSIGLFEIYQGWRSCSRSVT